MTLYSNCTEKWSGHIDRGVVFACHFGIQAKRPGNPCIHEPTKGPPLNRISNMHNFKFGNGYRQVIYRVFNQNSHTALGNLKHYGPKGVSW